MDKILAIDQSTSATKAALFDGRGQLLSLASIPHRQYYPQPGLVEHDALEIYHNVIAACRQVLDQAGRDGVAAIGITNQRETVALWDRSGQPVGRAIVWQDGRAKPLCERFTSADAAYIRERTGLPLSPLFSGAKVAWLLRTLGYGPQSSVAGLHAGTMDAWLIYRLTGEFLTDVTNAGRTQLMDLSALAWDRGCLDLFGIPAALLPEIRASDGGFGRTDLEGLLPCKVPVCAVAGDSHGAMFAQGCHERGSVKATYGTGCSVMLNTGSARERADTLAATVGWSARGKVCYALEGNISHAADTLSWLGRMGLLADPGASAAMAGELADNGGVYLVPAFTGLGSPWWRADTRALLCGLTLDAGPSHMVRAALEAIAYQVADVLWAMESSCGVRPGRILADGGASGNRFLMQFQSDIADVSVDVARGGNLSLRGVAWLAGLAVGLLPDIAAVASLREPGQLYSPALPGDTAAKWRGGWQEALQRAMLRPQG